MMEEDAARRPAGAPRAALALLAGVLLLACYAMYLNRVYYAHHGPFYDSLSYMTHLAKVMGTMRNQGFGQALFIGLEGQTVFLPWLEGILLAMFVNPLREHAVLIQLPLVLALAFASYYFFRKVARYPAGVSVAFALAMVCFQAIFKVDGGLSDLRMDLAQALAFGAAVVVLALARATMQPRWWVLFGLALGAAFLFRATTPVYAVLLFGGCALVDLALGRQDRKALLRLYLFGIAAALLVSLWFFIRNVQYLHYYYFVWNFDANAKLPLSESVKHLEFVRSWHLGKPMLLLMAVVLVAEVVARVRARQPLLRGVNWLLLAGGAVPLAFLVLFGAALNPYVSMVGVPGLLIFALAPYAAAADVPWSRWRSRGYVAAAAIAILATVQVGIDTHSRAPSPFTPGMAGLRELTGAIHKDLQARGKPNNALEVTYVGGLDSMVILNSLIFDHGYTFDITSNATLDGIGVMPIQPGMANPVEWNAIAGATPAEKLATLVAGATKNADYLVVPENGTTLQPFLAVSPHAFAFRDMLLAQPGMTRLAGPIRVSSMETVSLYRNGSR